MKQIRREMAQVAEKLWYKGWAERNAGNMSVNVTDLLKESPIEREGELCDLDDSYPELEGQYILLSGSGTRMHELAKRPKKNTCLIYIGEGGKNYILFKHKESLLIPTSELATHLAVHEKFIRDGKGEKALLHSHVSELVALTQIKEFTSEAAINKLVWSMHPETVLFIPDGVGFVPYTLPGTREIAIKTQQALDKHKLVIWEKHGCLATGKTLLEAFEAIDILAKAVNIFFTCRNAGYEPEGLTDGQLEEIRNLNSEL